MPIRWATNWLRKPGMKRTVLIISIICALIVIESNLGIVYMRIANMYNKEVIIPITTVRDTSNMISIGIVVIIKDTGNAAEYAVARQTVECYAKYHKYPFHLVDISLNKTYEELCPYKDIMFQRHCVMSFNMLDWKEDWLLFLDADMAVINPNHLIENYLSRYVKNVEQAEHISSTQIIFYQRMFNHEIMAGTYIIRNTEYSRNFLLHWAKYELKLPNSFHGSDNGALHSAVISYQLPNQSKELERCEIYWKRAKYYDSLSIYEVCAQEILQKHQLEHFIILPKNRSAWARDGWLTNSVWSEKDFIVHGWQERRRDRYIFARWHSPLILTEGGFKMDICTTPEAHYNWRYKDTFMVSDDYVDDILNEYHTKTSVDFERIREKIH